MNSNAPAALQQVRKPYTITKQRERWTDDEHARFLEALKLFGRAWRKIEEYIGTKTAVQIRSHAQKFFSKLEREGRNADIYIPPPRPKRKPNHPYPKKAGLNSPDTPADSPKSSSKSLDTTTTTTTTPRSVRRGFKLFGQLLVESSSTDHPAEESGVESGSLIELRSPVEVSSESRETTEKARDHCVLVQFLGLLPPGQVSPWQLLTPQGSTNITATQSTSSEKKSDEEEEEEVEGERKRRRETSPLFFQDQRLRRSSSSSYTPSSSDGEETGSSRRPSTTLTLESQGFVPYKRPARLELTN